MSDIPELTENHFAKAIPATLRRRLMGGQFESGADVVALRRFVGLPQRQFANALGVTVHTLCAWEQSREVRKDQPSHFCVLRHDIRASSERTSRRSRSLVAACGHVRVFSRPWDGLRRAPLRCDCVDLLHRRTNSMLQ